MPKTLIRFTIHTSASSIGTSRNSATNLKYFELKSVQLNDKLLEIDFSVDFAESFKEQCLSIADDLICSLSEEIVAF